MQTTTEGPSLKKGRHNLPNITFITPPSAFLMDERVFPNLGILKVAASARERGIGIEMLDLSGFKNYQEIVVNYLEQSGASKFGITSTTPQFPATLEIVKAIRQVRGINAKIILGGPHATLVNAAYRNEVNSGIHGRASKAMDKLKEHFDVIVAGDGEKAIHIALNDRCPKIIDGDKTDSPLFLSNKELNDMALPARDLIDLDSYHYRIDGVRATTMIAQLGCPFTCGFCGGRQSPTLRNIRMRTAKSVVDEMVYLYKTYGYHGFMMYDDELNVNKGMVELMRLIHDTQRSLGVEWKLRGFIKSQLFTEEQAQSMYLAGFRWILVGFESGSPEILEAINKKATREENTRCLEIAKRHGLKVKALMSIGHPGESPETISDTKSWLLETKPNDFDISIITCYPGTPYYDRAVPHPTMKGVWVYTCPTGKDLYQLEVDFSTVAEYYKGDPDEGKSFVFTKHLSSEKIVEARRQLEYSVRHQLGIPFPPKSAAQQHEHSMGQGFPTNILKVST